MWNRVILLLAVVAVAGCGGKKKSAPGSDQGGQMASVRPSPEVANIQKRLALSVPEKERYAALDQLVKGWPRTKGALTAALGLLRADKENRGGFAMSLARLGRPLVPALNQMVARASLHLPTLLAAGVLSYHLVVRSGLTKRTDAELAAMRKALRPSFEPIYAAFRIDTRPEYEIYQGVAVGTEEAIRRFGLPIAKGGLTRVAMVLYLILSGKPNGALLPAADRARLRKQAVGLAKPFAEALAKARPDGTGESPDSLMLGLSVLGIDAAKALAAVPDLGKQGGCLVAIKSAYNLLDEVSASEVAPLRPLLQRCTGFKWDANPRIPQALKKLLAKLPAGNGKP